jgi:16S rRNA (guanine527-N7)-methyltransferase
MDQILSKYSQLKKFNVSRETCLDFEKFTSMIIKKNKEINIISKKTERAEIIKERHIIDSAQAIDFIGLNCKSVIDIGTGGGFPGIIVAIMLKNMKNSAKVKLYEKSYHKAEFLSNISKKLNLDTEVIQKDIFESSELEADTIMSRAFKPLPIILELANKNFKRYENIIMFMGKKGKEVLKQTQKEWNFDYKEKKSITSEDSFLINIKNIKKI